MPADRPPTGSTTSHSPIGPIRQRRSHRVHRGALSGPLLAAPALALLALFVLWPLARTAQLSAYGSDLLGNPTRFVGWANYTDALTDPGFARTVVVSLVLALGSTALASAAALAAALLLRAHVPAEGVLRVVLSLPFAYSAATASAVFAGLFAPTVGVLDVLLADVGLPGPGWLLTPALAVTSIAVATAWYEVGFAVLVLVAAVRDIPTEVVEAAQLDGAAGWRLAASVLVPLLRPSLLFLAVTQTIAGLQTFAQVQVLTRGGPAGGTTNLVYQLYSLAFGDATPQFGRASVVALALVVLVAAVTAVQFALLGRERTA